MAFLRTGCDVAAICPRHHYLHTITGIEALYPYRQINPTGSLRQAIRAARPDLIVPCDDSAAWHLQDLGASEPEFRPLIERSLGKVESYPILKQREAVLEIAAELGIRVPRTVPVSSPAELDHPRLDWPGVLKVDGTWGGEGVAIVRSRQEARDAFRSLVRAAGSARAWRRFLISRHPLALWQWQRRGTPAIVWQSLISGSPATSMFACSEGELLASIAVEVLASTDPTGAAVVVRVVENAEMERTAKLLARRLQLSGVYGLDFILEQGTGAACLLEMNPRATQLGHLNACREGNLADALAARLKTSDARPAPRARLSAGDIVALFPGAWKANPADPLLTGARHDVPWEQPELVRELLKSPWPERQVVSRLFAALLRRRPREAGSAQGSGKDQSPQAG